RAARRLADPRHRGGVGRYLCCDSGCKMTLRSSGDVIVQRHDLGGLAELDPLEAAIDALPPGRDEVDEQREVVEARVAFRDELLLEALEPADRVGRPAFDLADV